MFYSHCSEKLKRGGTHCFLFPGGYNSLWILMRVVDVCEGETRPLEERDWSFRGSLLWLLRRIDLFCFCTPVSQEYNMTLNIPRYVC